MNFAWRLRSAICYIYSQGRQLNVNQSLPLTHTLIKTTNYKYLVNLLQLWNKNYNRLNTDNGKFLQIFLFQIYFEVGWKKRPFWGFFSAISNFFKNHMCLPNPPSHFVIFLNFLSSPIGWYIFLGELYTLRCIPLQTF